MVSSAAIFILCAIALLTGCRGPTCSEPCSDGTTCIRVDASEVVEPTAACVVRCNPANGAQVCGVNSTCQCPDSPMGQRCVVIDDFGNVSSAPGEAVFYCAANP